MSAQPFLQSVNTSFAGEVHEPPSVPQGFGGSTSGEPPAPNSTRAVQKQRAEKSLPTDRHGFEKQVEALGSIAQLSGNSKRPVNAEDVSASLNLKGNTGGLSNKFFRDCGWVESSGRGAYVATDDLLAYRRHLAVDPSDLAGSFAYLVPAARRSWFRQEIGDMLEGAGVRETMVMHALAKAAGATSNHMAQLKLIVDWLGLVVRDGELLQAKQEAASVGSVTPEVDEETGTPAAEPAADAQTETPGPAADTSDFPPPTRTITPTLGGDEPMLSMHFSVRMTADDVAKLSGDQLQGLLAFAEKMRSNVAVAM